MRTTAFVLPLLLIIAASAVGDDQRVGSLGDPKQWHIRGLELLDSNAVRERLSLDFEVLLAAHPQAPLTEFPAMLEKRLMIGLRRSGFRDARVFVRVDWDKGLVEMDVTEGARLGSGKVVVTGVEDQLANNIIAALTLASPDYRDATPTFDSAGNVLQWIGPDGDEPEKQEAIWSLDQPAPFDDLTMVAVQKRVQTTLEDVGYAAAKCNISLVQREQVADLTIHVADLGPRSVLQAIEIAGNERDSDAEMVRYLGVQLGERLTRQRRVELIRSLWESGRFVEQNVQFKANENGTTLQITVVETPGAPCVNDPLPRHTLALLKCRTWLTVGEGRNHDLVIRRTSGRDSWIIVLSREGILLALNGADAAANVPEYALTFGNDGISWYEIPQQRKLLSVKWKLRLEASVALAAINNSDRRNSIKFGIQFAERGDSADVAPFVVQTSLAPSYFVAMGANPDARIRWEEDVLLLRTRGSELVVDSKTGEFLGSIVFDDSQRPVATLTVHKNQFRLRRDQLVNATRDHADQFNSTSPISSLLGFLARSRGISELCDRLAVTAEHRAKVSASQALLQTFVDRGLLQPLDEMITESSPAPVRKKVEFQIPDSEPPPTGYPRMISRFAVRNADVLFPRDSWPWILWRETAFIILGKQRYSDLELRRVIDSYKSGPICHWLLIEMCFRTDNHQLAALIAQLGLDKLDRLSFRSDCQQLLLNSRQSVVPTLRWFGNQNDAQLDAIAKAFSLDPHVLIQIRDSLRSASEEDLPDAFIATLERLWVDHWRRRVETRMKQAIAERPATAREKTGDKAMR